MAMRRRFNPWGFALASLAAPAISVIVFVAGLTVAAVFLDGARWLPASTVGGWVLLVLGMSLLGWLPSAVCGGAVLGALLSLVPSPSSRLLGVAGAAAAAVYVVLAVAAFPDFPGPASLFAPWGAYGGSNLQDPIFWAIPVSIVLSGGLAGLIYARFAKRG